MARPGKPGWLKRIVVAASVVALVAGVSPAGEAQTTFSRILREKLITFGFANEPPFTIATMGGVTGTDPEILKAIMRTHGVEKYNGVLAEFTGMIPGLLAKRFDVIAAGMYVRPARCKQVAFSNPNLTIREGLLVKKGNPLNLHSLKDIAANPKARVAAHQGSVEYEYLAIAGVKQSQILGFPDIASSVEALRTGRVDAVSNSVPLLVGQEILKDRNLELADPFENPVYKDGTPILSYVSVAFRKTDRDFLDAYNRGLNKLRDSGKLAEIIAPFGFKKADIPPANLTAAKICAGP